MVKKLRNRALVTTTNFYYIDSQYFRMLLAIDYVFILHTKINLKLFILPGTYEADFLVRSDSFYSLRDSIQCLSHSLLPHKKNENLHCHPNLPKGHTCAEKRTRFIFKKIPTTYPLNFRDNILKIYEIPSIKN